MTPRPTSAPALPAGPRLTARPALRVLVTGVSSDAHTWNLVFLQKYVEEAGHHVLNLGPCVPDDLLVESCLRYGPDLVVLSSVNGHGLTDGLSAIRALRSSAPLAATTVVIGGKLTTSGELTGAQAAQLADAGFDAVFDDGSLAPFKSLLTSGRALRHGNPSITASA
jgi:methylaspartate mutase sigma subunit